MSEIRRSTTPSLFKSPWVFLRSVPSIKFLPPEGPPEIAFIGRSNVGKSSLINVTVGQTRLAKISSTPGCTQCLNYFHPAADPKKNNGKPPPLFLVDMPGYGYAKAPENEIKRWTNLVFSYLKDRATLKRLYVLIDSRHGIGEKDEKVFSFLDTIGLSYQIVFTKADKIKASETSELMENTIEKIECRPASFPELILTSSRKKAGISDLRRAIISALG